ncbi:hypothetical protein JB92DRAFT_3048898, partial [Gautieria morchelliformis]
VRSCAAPDSGLLGVSLHPVLQLTFSSKTCYDRSIKPLYHFLIGEASDLKKLVLRDNQPHPVLDHRLYRDPGWWKRYRLLVTKPVIPRGSPMRKFQYEILKPVDSIRDLVIESRDNMLDILPLLEDPLLCPRITTLSFVGASGKKSFGKKLLAIATSRRGNSASTTQIQLLECLPLANTWTAHLKNLGIDCKQTKTKHLLLSPNTKRNTM